MSELETVIPHDSADYLERKPIRYSRKTIVLDDGSQYDLNAPGPFDPATTLYQTPLDPVLEAAVFETELHPRWPKGSGLRSGEFMRVGEHFKSSGVEWEISHIVKGHIIAHRYATQKSDGPQTKTFEVTMHPGEGHAHVSAIEEFVQAPVPKGSKSGGGTVTIVSPYVDSKTHDPSIAVPSTSKITPEEWQRFGRLDQLVYVEHQERFGEYKDSTQTQALVDAAYQKFSKAAADMARSAYQSQYGSSSGHTLSLADGQIHGAAPELRAEAVALLGEHAAAVQWDLMNRTHSPDITLSHKSGHDKSWWQQKITDKLPVFSTLSQAWAYKKGGFGGHGMVTPMAIRHLVLSTQSAKASSSASSFAGEKEVATPYRWIPDERSLPISDGDGSQVKGLNWLAGATTVPTGGSVAEALVDSIKNGTYLAPVAQPPQITMDGASGKTWIDPPPEAADPKFEGVTLPTEYGAKIPPADLPKGVPWNKVDAAGNPVAQTGEEAGAHVGQYFMGLAGTLYWIGPDPGASGGYPYHIFKIQNGEFTSENFGYNANQPGYYTNKSFDISNWLEVQNKAPGFEPSLWGESLDAKFLETFQPGEKFLLNGTAWEVMPGGNGVQVPVMDLNSGLKGKINGTYKTSYLVPKGEGSKTIDMPSPEHQKFQEGQWVKSAFGKGLVTKVEGTEGVGQLVTVEHVGGPSSMKAAEFPAKELSLWPQQVGVPALGSTFEHEGKKATVTKIMASGKIQANLKPGKLQLSPQDFASAHGHHVVPISSLQIEPQKTKLKDMAPGDLFHGSAGNQTIRPYQVVYKGEGSKTVYVQNLDNGHVEELSRNVSYRRLTPVASDSQIPHDDQPKGAPVNLTGPGGVGAAWDPAKFEPGPSITAQNMAVGDYFTGTYNGIVYQKTEDTPTHSKVVVVDSVGTGTEGQLLEIAHGGTPAPFETLVPKAQGPPPEIASPSTFVPGDYNFGPKVHIKDMPLGTIFQTEDGERHVISKDDGGDKTLLSLDDGHVITVDKTMLDASPEAVHTTLVPDTPQLSTHSDGWQTGQTQTSSVGHLAIGDHFKSASPGNNIFEVTGPPDGEGFVPAKLVASSMLKPVIGKELQFQKETVVSTAHPIPGSKPAALEVEDHSVLAGPQATPFDPSSYIESDKIKIGDMAPGTVFKTDSVKKGSQYYKLSDDGQHTTNLLTGKVFPAKPKWHGTVMEKQRTPHVEHEYTHPPNSADPPEDSAPPEFKSVPGTIGALSKGDTFKVPEGYFQAGKEFKVHDTTPQWHPPVGHLSGYHTIEVSSADGVSSMATNLKLDPAPEDHADGTVLKDKATNVTPYAQLSKGDTTTVEALRKGDTFSIATLPGVFEVIKPAGRPSDNLDDTTSYADVQAIEGSGAHIENFSLHPTGAVQLQQKAEHVMPVSVPQTLIDSLPEAVENGKLQGFKQASAGAYIFTPIEKLPAGAIAEDAAGKKWLVKQPGAVPVLSNGLYNYRVHDPSIKLADTAQAAFGPQAPFQDWADPLATEPGTMEQKAAKADLVPNAAEMPIAGLHIKEGDFLQWKGNVAKVLPPDNANVKVEDVVTGKHSYLSQLIVPEKISPGHTVPAPEPAPPEPEVTAELPAAPTQFTHAVKATQLAVGDKFTLAPGSGHVYTAGMVGSEMAKYKGDHGEWHSAMGTVYTQPEAAAATAPAAEPPKAAVDPAEPQPVHTVEDMAPHQEVPQISGTQIPDALAPFGSPKGAGGVYSHIPLKELQVGQMFTDKSGEDFQVIGHQGDKTIYRSMTTSAQFSAASSGKVKLTALPPEPGPHLKPVIADLTAKYGSLENVPKLSLEDAATSTSGTGGKASNPRLGHLKYGQMAMDGQGHKVVFLGSWLNRALVLDVAGQPKLAPAGTRVKLLG
jgi:hypothetical protein